MANQFRCTSKSVDRLRKNRTFRSLNQEISRWGSRLRYRLFHVLFHSVTVSTQRENLHCLNEAPQIILTTRPGRGFLSPKRAEKCAKTCSFEAAISVPSAADAQLFTSTLFWCRLVCCIDLTARKRRLGSLNQLARFQFSGCVQVACKLEFFKSDRWKCIRVYKFI